MRVSILTPHPAHEPVLDHPAYRADIDGLRAIAVGAVVAFHAFPDWVRGGYVGVDVFFVISGYLISSIIFKGIQGGSFGLLRFYGRRVRRIFPALIVVLIFCLGCGSLILFADEYKQLGLHTMAGAGFLSNILLWSESGYFDNSAETKPLLHLWSLGIEEQFYIVWPLLLWVMWRQKIAWSIVIITAGMISFAWNLKTIGTDATATFYSPQTRFWELLVGSLLAYGTLYPGSLPAVAGRWRLILPPAWRHRNDHLRTALSLFGVTAIIGSALLFTKETQFPGAWAILPTIGAAALIGTGPRAWLNRWLLANPLMVWIGLISFPLYLWHWPLLSFLRVGTAKPLTPLESTGAVVAAIVLAWLTSRLIERPLRFGAAGSAKAIALCAAIACVGGAGYYVYSRDGLPSRTAAIAGSRSAFDGSWDGLVKACEPAASGLGNAVMCRQDVRAAPRYVVLGDSKAGVVAPGLVRTSSESGRWMLVTSGPEALIPVISDAAIYRRASPRKIVEAVVDTIGKMDSVETVAVITSTRGLFGLRWDDTISDLPATKFYDVALDGLSRTVSALVQVNKNVVLVVDNPTLAHPEDCLSRTSGIKLLDRALATNQNCRIGLDEHARLSSNYLRLLNAIAERHPGKVDVFPTAGIFCDAGEGVCSHFRNGRPLYGLTDHASDYAGGLLGRELNAYLGLRAWHDAPVADSPR